MEFNADGSIKLPGSLGKKHEEDANKMKNTRCVKITKDAVKTTSPKMCMVNIKASPIIAKDFIEKTYGFFAKRVDSTVGLRKVSDTEYNVTIGNEFSRCRDCQTLVTSFREYLEGNVIEKKGTCTFKGGGHWY